MACTPAPAALHPAEPAVQPHRLFGYAVSFLPWCLPLMQCTLGSSLSTSGCGWAATLPVCGSGVKDGGGARLAGRRPPHGVG